MTLCVLLLQLIVASAVPGAMSQASTPSRPDSAVLEAVLCDLATYSGRDLPLSLPPKQPRHIFFSTSAPQPPEPPLCGSQTAAADLSLSGRLSPKIREADDDASRNSKERHGIRDYKPSSPYITADGQAVSNEYQSQFPVSAWPPGYSRDGSVAIVYLWFPELLHPSIGIYILERTSEGWTVRARMLRTFA